MMNGTRENARGQAGVDTAQNFQVPLCYPPAGSVKGRVLAALLRGETLTHLDCWRQFGSSRLAHHVWALREDGWPVKTEERHVSTSDGGRQAVIALYSMPEPAIQAAGDAGRRYADGDLEARHVGAGQ